MMEAEEQHENHDESREMEVDDEEEEDNGDASSEDDSSSESESDSDDDDDHDTSLYNALFPPPPPVDNRSPLERWNEYIGRIRSRNNKVLKFVNPQLRDELSFLTSVAVISDNQNNNNNQDELQREDDDLREGGRQAAAAPSWMTELFDAITTAAVDPETSTVTGYLTHAIIGSAMLKLLGPEGQKQFFLAIASHSTLAYLELQGIEFYQTPMKPVEDDGTCSATPTALYLPAIIEALVIYPTPALSEMELVGVRFPTIASVQQWATILEQRRGTLRQVNLVGIEPPSSTTSATNPSKGEINYTSTRLCEGWLDPILLALAIPDDAAASGTTTPMDELRLVMRQQQEHDDPSDYHNRNKKHQISAITPDSLRTLLLHKKKWWRLGLDGLGLNDQHLHVLTTMFRRDETCKAGDLLSLERNPNISSQAYEEFFEGCFFWKRRMGLIKVDDKVWEGRFDLVRSMNNLHNRLDYVVSNISSSSSSSSNSYRPLSNTCSNANPLLPSRSSSSSRTTTTTSSKRSFASRTKWVEWLAKLGTGLAWEDDKHRINYLWFTLLEKPEFIYSHA